MKIITNSLAGNTTAPNHSPRHQYTHLIAKLAPTMSATPSHISIVRAVK
ncbi:MAG: hypothetical protein Q3971_08760 [Moraxella sp.]|nr:hypothetical protein [Moraxella sp.]